ncbi:hypothetical protein AGMMS49938_09040 [Fibrobacterales bacterium]|nr:hypothetical protein AGMMS49938_09040 [Fibrobacterales bacterium]
MKTYFVILILFLFSVSQAYFGRVNEGQAVFGWVELLQSPRTASLEGAGSAFASEDLGAAIVNPALLSGEKIGASIFWQSGDLADKQGIVAISHPFFKNFGGRMQHTYGVIDNGEVENYNENGNETGLTSYPISQYYAISAAFPLSHFRVGISGRFLWERLSEIEGAQAGMGLSFDWGLLWNSTSARYGFALVGRHLGVQVRPFVKNGANGYALSQELAASAFWRANQNLTWLFECNAPRYSPAVGKLGVEYRLANPLHIRAGIQRELLDVVRLAKSIFDSDENAPKAGYYRLFSAGAGYKLADFSFGTLAVDYSYSMLIEGMGSEHRVGLNARF